MASGKAAQPHNAGAQPQIHWTSFVRRHHSFLGTAIDQRIGRWRLAWLHCFGNLGRKATAGGQGTAAALETVAQQTHGRRQGVKWCCVMSQHCRKINSQCNGTKSSQDFTHQRKCPATFVPNDFFQKARGYNPGCGRHDKVAFI